MDASLLIGCAWTDSPFTSTSVIVIAEQDRELATRHATRLALEIWERRHEAVSMSKSNSCLRSQISRASLVAWRMASVIVVAEVKGLSVQAQPISREASMIPGT